MAEDDASPTDRDLRDLQGCLKSIAENLSSMCNENVASNDFVILKIKQIYDNFPDMWWIGEEPTDRLPDQWWMSYSAGAEVHERHHRVLECQN